MLGTSEGRLRVAVQDGILSLGKLRVGDSGKVAAKESPLLVGDRLVGAADAAE